MKISVIIPALNEVARIGHSVQRAWEAGGDEVLVADGGSTDGTVEIAQAQQCSVVSANAGRALQQNAAAAVATGDVLLFLHVDNWLEPRATDQIRSALRDPRIAFGAFRQRIAAGGMAYRLLEWGNAQRIRWLKAPYGDQGIFVRREVFIGCGGFPQIPLMEDLSLAKKLRHSSYPVLLPGPLHVDARRWQKQGPLRQTVRNWILVGAYKLGVSPNYLAKFYPRHDHQPE